MNKLAQNQQGPTTAKERHVILDALRGLALLGIALANFPEFALWTFLSADEQQAMTTAGIDSVVRYMQYMLVDGKFYTIFSLLFGVGFSLILSRHPVSLFVRRMLILAVIGFCHLMFIWSGDILLLYGLGFGLGCSFGLVYVELTAFAVFVLQIVVCKWWLRHFRFGPLEWVWRMLTYGRYFQFKVTKEDV